tara:strand:- start:437 stop:766 length:330 start_codon:yes stop_codon:yes gene_type:complete
MATSIGRLRSKVELQSPTSTDDGGGGCTETWSTLAEIFADIRPSTGNETYRQGKVQETVSHKIFIRHREDINTSYRIKFGTRLFNIKNILNIDERSRFLEISANEGEPA